MASFLEGGERQAGVEDSLVEGIVEERKRERKTKGENTKEGEGRQVEKMRED